MPKAYSCVKIRFVNQAVSGKTACASLQQGLALRQVHQDTVFRWAATSGRDGILSTSTIE